MGRHALDPVTRREHRLASKAKWLAAHRELYREIKREWVKNNPDKSIQYVNQRRAIKKQVGGRFTAFEWKMMKARYEHCLYPGCSSTDLTIDHVVPLSMGGRHEASNIQPLCRVHNSHKHTQVVDYRKDKFQDSVLSGSEEKH